MRTAKNPIERRLHEVAESSAELRAEIKRLERALRKPERLLENPHLLPTTRPITPRVRTTAPDTTSADIASPPVIMENAASSDPLSGGQDRRTPASSDERFARYFSSTRFLGPPALGRERNIQRNRAIVLLIGALILGFIVFRLIFH